MSVPVRTRCDARFVPCTTDRRTARKIAALSRNSPPGGAAPLLETGGERRRGGQAEGSPCRVPHMMALIRDREVTRWRAAPFPAAAAWPGWCPTALRACWGTGRWPHRSPPKRRRRPGPEQCPRRGLEMRLIRDRDPHQQPRLHRVRSGVSVCVPGFRPRHRHRHDPVRQALEQHVRLLRQQFRGIGNRRPRHHALAHTAQCGDEVRHSARAPHEGRHHRCSERAERVEQPTQQGQHKLSRAAGTCPGPCVVQEAIRSPEIRNETARHANDP